MLYDDKDNISTFQEPFAAGRTHKVYGGVILSLNVTVKNQVVCEARTELEQSKTIRVCVCVCVCVCVYKCVCTSFCVYVLVFVCCV